MFERFKEAVSEIHNITWPTKKHAINISRIAIIFTLVSAVFIWFSDYVFKEWYSLVSPKAKQDVNSFLKDIKDTSLKINDDKGQKIELNSASWKEDKKNKK